jgi:nuclear distribution protein NudE
MPPASPEMSSKRIQVLDMLAETKAELDEFHHASKELEAELEAELARTEKAQMELKVKVSRAETERDDWKVRRYRLASCHTTDTSCPCSSPSSCLSKRPTIRPLLHCNASWTS